MGRPGNKRLQRALYGASPSSATGSLTTEGEGRYAVTRVTGSVINNGGNMRSGGFPRVGMGLEFLRKTRVTENCCFVGTDEDLTIVPTPLARATTWISSLSVLSAETAADTKASTLSGHRVTTTTAVTARNAATTLDNISTTQAELDASRIAEATALVAYNVAFANHAASVAAYAYTNTQNAINLAAWLVAEV